LRLLLVSHAQHPQTWHLIDNIRRAFRGNLAARESPSLTRNTPDKALGRTIGQTEVAQKPEAAPDLPAGVPVLTNLGLNSNRFTDGIT
jgi:hypothetical protein